MNQNLIENLNRGLFLEKSKEFIPWETPFDNLNKIGKSELKEHSEQRTDIIWENEEILNGISVNLIVMRWNALLRTYNFTHAHSYLAEEEFEKIKIKLDSELSQEGKYKKINKLEYKYTWKLKRCKVELSQRDRFGSYWIIDVKQTKRFWFWN